MQLGGRMLFQCNTLASELYIDNGGSGVATWKRWFNTCSFQITWAYLLNREVMGKHISEADRESD